MFLSMLAASVSGKIIFLNPSVQVVKKKYQVKNLR